MPTDPNLPAPTTPDPTAQRVVSAGKMGQDLLSVPFPDMVRDLAMSIASAQMELDRSSVRIAQLMAGYEQVTDPVTGAVSFQASDALRIRFGQGKSYNLLQLGFTPTFYQFVDTIIEVKIAITMASSDSYEQENKAKNVDRSTGILTSLGKGGTVKASSVNARYSQQYSYSAEGSSLIRTKLVPIPPPPILEERIRKMMEAEDAAQETGLQVDAASTALQTARQKKDAAVAEKGKAEAARTAAEAARTTALSKTIKADAEAAASTANTEAEKAETAATAARKAATEARAAAATAEKVATDAATAAENATSDAARTAAESKAEAARTSANDADGVATDAEKAATAAETAAAAARTAATAARQHATSLAGS